jgi:hypothetical protein
LTTKPRLSTSSYNDGATSCSRETDAQAEKQGFAPDVLVTANLRSYAAVKSEMALSAHHEQ